VAPCDIFGRFGPFSAGGAGALGWPCLLVGGRVVSRTATRSLAGGALSLPGGV
jgi:hypothetical protein